MHHISRRGLLAPAPPQTLAIERAVHASHSAEGMRPRLVLLFFLCAENDP